MVKKRFPYVTVIIIAFIIGLLSFAYFFKFPTGESIENFFIQYNGNLNSDYGDIWIQSYPYPISTSNTVIIDNFKIIQQKSARPNEEIYSGGEPIYACKPNDCNGVQSGYATIGDITCPTFRNSNVASSEDCWLSLGGRNCNSYYGYPTIQASDCSKGAYWGKDCYKGTHTVYSQVDCGGYIASNSLGIPQNLNCYWQADIYKDNALIKHIGWVKESKSYDFDNLHIQFDQTDNYLSKYSDCIRINNAYYWRVPDDSFKISVSFPPNQVFQNQDATFDVKITNNWKPVKANMILDLKVNTGLLTPSTERKEQVVDLAVGENTFSYTIPTGNVLNELDFKPQLDILLEGNKISGVNGLCYGDETTQKKDLSSCQYILLASYPQDWQSVQINAISQDCRTLKCTIGVCQNDGTCLDMQTNISYQIINNTIYVPIVKKVSDYTPLIIGGIVFILSIIVLIIVLVKKKR